MLEPRRFIRRLRLEIEEVPRLRKYRRSARLHGLRPLAAKAISARLVDCESKQIAYALDVHPSTVRLALRESLERLKARGLFECRRILEQAPEGDARTTR